MVNLPGVLFSVFTQPGSGAVVPDFSRRDARKGGFRIFIRTFPKQAR
jgi:hypothetical protein